MFIFVVFFQEEKSNMRTSSCVQLYISARLMIYFGVASSIRIDEARQR